MVLVAPRSAKLVEARGARFTLLLGYVFLLLAFLAMLLLWKEGSSYWEIGIAYAFIGIGVGLAGTPASHSLTSSVPVRRAGMASGTADLQRDLGGAIMQSIFGALLTAGYAPRRGGADHDLREARLREHAGRADEVVRERGRHRVEVSRVVQSEIIAGAKTAFLHGDQWAYTAGVVAILVGAVLVFFCFPKQADEEALLAHYAAADAA